MKPGIKSSEVVDFIDQQHRQAGADAGSTFCIVSFGAATSLPHGADGDQILGRDDVILVDTGCRIDGYHSDITRTYMLEGGNSAFERAWWIEREAQQAVFDAARIGAACSSLDDAARKVLAKHSSAPTIACQVCRIAPVMASGSRFMRNPTSFAATTRRLPQACVFPTNR